MSEELQLHTTFEKIDEDRRLAFGWAYTTKIGTDLVIDHSGDFIDDQALPDLEHAVYDFVKDVREADEMHMRDEGIAKLVESLVVTPEKLEMMGLQGDRTGWWTAWFVEDDGVWAKVKDGTYCALSIRGIGEREHVSDGAE